MLIPNTQNARNRVYGHRVVFAFCRLSSAASPCSGFPAHAYAAAMQKYVVGFEIADAAWRST